MPSESKANVLNPDGLTQPDNFNQKMAETTLRKMRGLLEPFEPKFYIYGYLVMFLKLIVTPGMKKSELALFLEIEAKVSRSTADRFIREASEGGHVVINNPDERPGLEITLADHLTAHFEAVFRNLFDPDA